MAFKRLVASLACLVLVAEAGAVSLPDTTLSCTPEYDADQDAYMGYDVIIETSEVFNAQDGPQIRITGDWDLSGLTDRTGQSQVSVGLIPKDVYDSAGSWGDSSYPYPGGSGKYIFNQGVFELTGLEGHDYYAALGDYANFSPGGSPTWYEGEAGKAPAHLRCGDGSFSATPEETVSASPSDICTGDFDHDGRPDAAVVSYSENKVEILGNQSGSVDFSPVGEHEVGEGPVRVISWDLNDDGHMDLVAANETAGSVSVLLGEGDGTFPVRNDFETGDQPFWITVEDFDDNGLWDLAVANHESDDLSVLLGKGDGTFHPHQIYYAAKPQRNPNSIASGDVDGDGKVDLVTTNGYVDYIDIFKGAGDGTFAWDNREYVGHGNCSGRLVDMNGDGILDVVVGKYNEGRMKVMLGNGDGTFTGAGGQPAGGKVRTLQVADIDADGLPDVVTVDREDDKAWVLLSHGDGSFDTPLGYSIGGDPRGIVVEDLDGDGAPDLATANLGSDNVSILTGNLVGDGQFAFDTRLVPSGSSGGNINLAVEGGLNGYHSPGFELGGTVPAAYDWTGYQYGRFSGPGDPITEDYSESYLYAALQVWADEDPGYQSAILTNAKALVVPEPCTALLLVVACGGLCAAVKRGRREHKCL